MYHLNLLRLRATTSWRKIGLLLSLIILAILPLIIIKEAITQTQTFYGVHFPQGAVSFADEVVAYNPGVYLNEDKLPNVKEPFDNPRLALGTPMYSPAPNAFWFWTQRNDVALGLGGNLILKFTNNVLAGSGDRAVDLWIFTAGEKPEAVLVEISQDGSTWHPVGRTTAQNQGIDIDASGWGSDDFFAYVRLTDDQKEGDHDGVWQNGEWIGWGGANINAVGAISSVSLVTSKWNFFPISIPFSWLILLVAFIAGLSFNFLLKRRKSQVNK